MQTILVTGGAGFIGSHTCVELLDAGFEVVVVDDLSNSSEVAIDRIRDIVVADERTGAAPAGASARLHFIRATLLDAQAMRSVFERFPIDAVIHFAGFKAVGESVSKPLEYYGNNLGGTMELLRAMNEAGCRSIVFSSSATVYGGNSVPYEETMPKGSPSSPYGWTKWMIEQMIADLCASDGRWSAVLLRYFNPVGAHPSGLIGEDPKGIPNNLMPYITQVAIGKRDVLHVFGDDYPTPDGTCQRDYIHVVDLAQGHVEALRWMEGRHGIEAFNLGSGESTSVLELVHAFSRACGHDIPYIVDGRRDGDLPAFWADPAKAKREMGWQTKLGIDRMCEDSWRWQSMNPDGFEG